GGISAVVAHDDQALVLALADQPREGAAELAGRLREEGVERIAMLTGDHKIIAEKLARELGIDDVHADLLPEQKVDIVREIKEDLNNEKTKEPRGSARGSAENNPLAHARGSLESEPARQMTPRRGLAVIGDGVNDAPALAVADVGLAMGGIGSDAALETADIVLLHDDIRRVPWAIGLARRVRRTMLVNLSIALGVIGVLVILTLLGNLKLGFGVVGHEGSTLVVVANSLRILGHRKP
ncbi:MAG TPA: HAD family hydrolase, partial [Phycisphaerales bacterium]|nr:HAD family hydrolase [Phycisphaerales bacterium]